MSGCTYVKADGSACESPEGLVENGRCFAHRAGSDYMREIGIKGGEATRAAMATPGFTVEELAHIETIEDAKRRLNVIHIAILTRKITSTEGDRAGGVVRQWLEAEKLAASKSIVNELMREQEILKKRLAACTCGAGGKKRSVR